MTIGNTTNITPPRVSLIDERTGAVSREWYRWFYSLFTTLGSGTGIIPVDSGGTGLGTIPTNGQLLIGNGTGYSLNTLGTGAGISVTNGLGTITIANTGVLSFSGGTTGLTPAAATAGVVTLAGTLIAVNGGTGYAAYAVGDLLYADTTTTLAKLPDVATGNALISGGVGVAPAWGKIGLTTHVSGILPIVNGGTNGSATPTAYGVAYGTGTAYAFTAAGTTGQVLTATTGSAPTWAAPATSGTVTSVGLAMPVQFAVTNSPVTSSGTLTAAWNTQAANVLLAGPASGAGAVPTFRALTTADLPALPYGTGTVTSVGLSLPSIMAVTNSPVTTSGTLTGTLTTQSVNSIFAGPSSGAAAAPTFRALTTTDIPALSYVTSVSGTAGRITATTGLTPIIDLASGVITAGTTGSITAIPVITVDTYGRVTSITTAANPQGTVTSVGLSLPSIMTVTNSPVTSSGTLTGTLTTQAANAIFAGPSSGAAAAPTFRALTTADIPALAYGTGTVTSVSVVSANGLAGTVATSTTTPAITLSTTVTGLLKGNGTAISAAVANTDYVPLSTVITKTADYTITGTDTWIINNKTGSALTLTFPAASSWTGRYITVKNMQAQAVNSASSNIVPIDSTTAGTAILLDVVGNWATMVSDGTNWIIMQAASNNNLLLE